MTKKQKKGKTPTQTKGFWDRTEPKPEVLSVRGSASRMARCLSFLRRITGWKDKKN